MACSEVDLRYIAASFLVLSGVLCERAEGSDGSEFEVAWCHQAEGCCMGCDGTLSPLEDLPAWLLDAVAQRGLHWW